MFVAFHANTAGLTWTTQPAGIAELVASVCRHQVDLTGYNQCRISAYIATSGFAGSILFMQYSTDGGTNWFSLSGTIPITQAQVQVSAWAAIPAGAVKDVLVRIAGSGGDGTVSPILKMIAGHFR